MDHKGLSILIMNKMKKGESSSPSSLDESSTDSGDDSYLSSELLDAIEKKDGSRLLQVIKDIASSCSEGPSEETPKE